MEVVERSSSARNLHWCNNTVEHHRPGSLVDGSVVEVEDVSVAEVEDA